MSNEKQSFMDKMTGFVDKLAGPMTKVREHSIYSRYYKWYDRFSACYDGRINLSCHLPVRFRWGLNYKSITSIPHNQSQVN